MGKILSEAASSGKMELFGIVLTTNQLLNMLQIEPDSLPTPANDCARIDKASSDQ
jgi:hypothetical protein